MASGGVLTHPQDVRSLSMKSDKLTVQGTGITPRSTTPSNGMVTSGGGGEHLSPLPDTSSRVSVASDDDVTHSVDDEEANSMLQGVVTMNQILEGQIEALRLRLQVEDKQHRDEKNRLRNEKDSVIHSKEGEIEDLKESMVNRDERIHTLVKASEEKDKTIQSKVSEIDELKKLVKQTEDYAHKLHKQIGRVKHEKQALETDTLYKEQNSEICRLTEELGHLKKRLGEMEQELHRASNIIQEQTARIRQLEEERGTMHATFREELDKATRAMRQEVERMREVMRQNYEEMRQLRDQNRQMHNDVKDIKDLLMKSKVSPRGFRGTGIQRPLTASPMNLFKPAEFSSRSPSPPKGGPNPRSPTQAVGVRTSQPGGTATPSKPGGEAGARAAVSRGAPGPQRGQPGRSSASKSGGQGALPSICTLKDEPGLPSIGRQATNMQARTKSAVRMSSGKSVRK